MTSLGSVRRPGALVPTPHCATRNQLRSGLVRGTRAPTHTATHTATHTRAPTHTATHTATHTRAPTHTATHTRAFGYLRAHMELPSHNTQFALVDALH